MDWDAYFDKAKKPSTLERMLMSKVEKMGIRFNPGRESLRIVAEFYKNSYPSAYQMLFAAYKREQELEATSAHSQEKLPNNTQKPPVVAPAAIQKGLEDELKAWMAQNRRTNA
ncbi:hypothetical protein [Marinobacterium rhizophilum]|uniref:hypothetical protein n=1 Tax=Marinobacterium rhizophilum TaxID=420402 RepID=UPI0003671914|nr:hypothetical protein [Marinobacterium rhizophilum]